MDQISSPQAPLPLACQAIIPYGRFYTIKKQIINLSIAGIFLFGLWYVMGLLGWAILNPSLIVLQVQDLHSLNHKIIPFTIITLFSSMVTLASVGVFWGLHLAHHRLSHFALIRLFKIPTKAPYQPFLKSQQG